MKFRLSAAAVAAFSCSAITSANAEVTADTVVITATRQAQSAREAIAEITVLEREEIEQAGLATVSELLARQPGIEFSRAGGRGASESLYIRGTNSGHALVLIDGMRVSSATTGATALQLIPLSQVERIEVLRGPASALYGSDAVGGVVQIFTKQADASPRLAAHAGGGTRSSYEVGVSHAHRSGPVSYGIKLGGNGTGGINAIESPAYPGYNDDRDGFRNANLSMNASYRTEDRIEVGGNFFASKTTSEYDAYQWDPSVPPFGAAVNAERDYRLEHRVTGASAYTVVSLTRSWNSTLRVTQSVDKSESPEAVVGEPASLFKTTQNQYLWQNDIRMPVGTALLAIERLEQEVDSSQVYEEKSRSINSAVAGWNATFGSHAAQLNLRADDNSQFGSHKTWLVGYGYRLTSNLRFATSYGTAFKAPTMNDLYYPFTPGVGGGNPDLKAEKTRNMEVALRFSEGANHARVTYFRNRIKNLIEWTTHPVTFESSPANVGEARIKGFELAGGTALGNWLLEANATYQDPEDKDTGEQLRRRAKAHGLLSATYLSGRFKGGVEVRSVGKRYDDPHWQTRLNRVRMSGYTLTNLFAEFAFNKSLSGFARIDNVFDREYDIARSATTVYGTPGVSAFAGVRYQLP